MFVVVAGTSSRLVSRELPIPSLSTRRPVNFALFTRIRLQSGAAHARPLAVEEEGSRHPEVEDDHGGEAVGRSLNAVEDNIALLSPRVVTASPGENGDRTSNASIDQVGTIRALKNDNEYPRERFRKYYRTLDALHFKPGPEIEHETITLGTAALGQPATIRILRDQRRKKIPRPKVVKDTAAEESDVGADELELLALTPPADDAGPDAIDAIVRTVHEEFSAFRQPDGSFLRKHCTAVAKQLFDGLTQEQLQGYLDRHEPTLTTSDLANLDKVYKSKLVVRTRWFSETSKLSSTAEQRLNRDQWKRMFFEKHPLSASISSKKGSPLSPKQKIIERILRQIWLVRAQDELALGELDIRVMNRSFLKVLLKHHTRVFQKRSEQFGVRFEIAKNQNVVRLVGQYGLVADVFRLIHQDLSDIRCEELSYRRDLARTPQTFKHLTTVALRNQSFIRQVERWTNTVIYVPANIHAKPYAAPLIYYLGPSTTDLDDARRLLVQALKYKDERKTHVQCDRTDSSPVPVDAPIEPGSTLPFQERHIHWQRWVYAEESKSKQAEGSALSSTHCILYDPADSRKLASGAAEHLFKAWMHRKAVTPTVNSPYWQVDEKRELQAFVGFIAHPAGKEIGKAVDRRERQHDTNKKRQYHRAEVSFDTLMRTPRNLLTGVPDLWTRLKTVITTVPQLHNQLLIRLKPGKVLSQSEKTFQLPDLELVFAVNEQTQSTTLASAQFVRAWRESDLLLPAQATDLRFVARSLIRCSDEIDPAILDFVANSQLDVFGNGRLRAPTRVALSVPRFACEKWPTAAAELGTTPTATAADPTGASIDRSPAAAPTASPGELMVDYYFDSLEHRSSLSTRYQGHSLEYSTIEAGQTGGRREELRFDLPDLQITQFSHSDAAGRQLYLDWFDGVREFNSRLSK